MKNSARLVFGIALLVLLACGVTLIGPDNFSVAGNGSEKNTNGLDTAFSQCPLCHRRFDNFSNPKITFRHEANLMKHISKGLTCQSCHTTFPHQPGQLIIKPSGAACERCHREAEEYRPQHAPARCELCHPAGFLSSYFQGKEHLRDGYRHIQPQLPTTPTVGLIDRSLPVTAGKCAPCHKLGVETPKVRFEHRPHFERGIRCLACHNEYPHKPDTPPVTPAMKLCSVCHSLPHNKQGMVAPKRCDFCHPPGFREKPSTHDADWMMNHKYEYKRGENCFACHEKSFCDDCHGYDWWPHPPGWLKDHPDRSRGLFRVVCLNCHLRNREFCDSCHHKNYRPKQGPWVSPVSGLSIHPLYFRDYGARYCIRCHSLTFCPRCHIRGVNR